MLSLGAKLIKANVTGVYKNKVLLDNSTEVSFDYLIIATGLTYLLPFRFANEDGLSIFKEIAAKLKTAKKVIIVGGGTVGIEGIFV